MSSKFYDFKNLKGDLTGGLVAGVVALPLALAFGVQSGLGAIAGLYGAIAVGIFAAIFGGTTTQASGPTGPMSMAVQGLCGAFVISNSLGEPIKNVPIEQMILLICGYMKVFVHILKFYMLNVSMVIKKC